MGGVYGGESTPPPPGSPHTALPEAERQQLTIERSTLAALYDVVFRGDVRFTRSMSAHVPPCFLICPLACTRE